MLYSATQHHMLNLRCLSRTLQRRRQLVTVLGAASAVCNFYPRLGLAMTGNAGITSLAADSMIASTQGDYRLSTRGAGAHQRTGSYTFDRATQSVTDSSDGIVGTFSANPIDANLVASSLSGDAEIRILQICDSEIMTEIQKPENDGAYFVLPSQLNGAEYVSNDVIIRSISEYHFDSTGGPRGQLAVHPAAGQFILDNAANEEIGRAHV
eukprot:TRINITY_DN108699_c0_g1_i1.p1 TRINITY_DN108699_c0_g1~~TRINITY_DN108699_c0_g1_i1.p1  ORF type:complete len:210 (-),score=26.86 TRINITY_DN108699_c0_g1_i1:30-659(-)